jgi:hypothetical protein
VTTHAPSISDVFGPDLSHEKLRETAGHLADQMLTHHWHVDRIPWGLLPPFPIDPAIEERRAGKLVRFYKAVVAVQTRAEEVAVSIARRLLVAAEEAKLDLEFRRAIAAIVNDEASHVATMLKLEALAAQTYPEIHPKLGESPLFSALMPVIETLEPAVIATFMAAYEASVAIRSYAEEQTYKIPSILGAMAPRAAEDDGRHAKTLRILARVFLDRFRAEYGKDDQASSPAWRTKILEPFARFWSLMPAHEYFLAGNDSRQLRNVRKQIAHDILIMRGILTYLNFSPEAREAVKLETIAELL